MGKIIGLVIGAYLVLGAMSLAGAIYGVSTGQGPSYDCTTNDLAITAGTAPKGTTGSNSAITTLALRFVAWPLSLSSALGSNVGLGDWFTLNYPYAPDACRWGGEAAPSTPT